MYLYSEDPMTGHGNTVIVYSHDEFERLLVLPTSLSGWFDPATSTGVVKFPSPQAAVAARMEA